MPLRQLAIADSSLLRHSSFVIRHYALLTILLASIFGSARAQPTNAPRPDPLMTLMLSQPKIDISSPVNPEAAFDPPVVAPGQETIYRVTFNALEETVDWPDKVAAPAGLQMNRGAHGEILRMGLGSFMPFTAFNYRVRASGLGTFTVPEFTVTVNGQPVNVPAARLEVVASPPSSPQAAARILLELSATNLVIGQPISARVLMPGTPAGLFQGLGQPQLTGQGFLVDLGGARQHYESVLDHGIRVPAYVYETTLTPMVEGKISVFGQGFTAGNRFGGSIVVNGTTVIQGGPPQYTLVETDPVELHVRPLPSEGQLPGFTGAIGRFDVGPPRLGTNVVRVGDVLTLTVTITNKSDGPLARLVAPPAPRPADWQVFPPAEVAPPAAVPLGLAGFFGPAEKVVGVTAFQYTLIPLTDRARATPAIPFSCFDPEAGRYVDLTIPPVPVNVRPGAMSADLQVLVQAATPAAEVEKEPVLSGLASSPGRTAATLVPAQRQAWFPFAQVAPAAVLAGLWSWDRRRRYYEKHPDVLLRRRARRALRREWRSVRQAARAKDAPRFASAAVSAMQVACAPHYPAEPRALVGKDVLAVLNASGVNGHAGDVVRRFFTATDATRFGSLCGQGSELLALEPEVERVLQELEARLQ